MTLNKLRMNRNEKGFTLIELMIVIAIIGILAAIAIPNFISYRDKAYCSAMESDAQSIAGAIADYFSIPTNTTVSVNAGNLPTSGGAGMSNSNQYTIGANGSNGYIITVTDATNRCPNSNTYTLTL